MACWRPGWVVGVAGALALWGCADGPTSAGGTDGGDSSGHGSSSGDSTGEETSEGSSSGGPLSQCGDPDAGVAPLRRLTRRQYANAVRDVLGVSVDAHTLGTDEKVGAFDSNAAAAVPPTDVEQYRVLAEAAAADAQAFVPALFACADGAQACWNETLDGVGRRLFRRPLTDDERARYLALAEVGEDPADGVRLVVQALLQSPQFLYHVEFGQPEAGEVSPLGSYELAARLSFFLWDSVPDDALLDAAAEGVLDDADGVEAEALRMLDDGRARDAIGAFHVQWLGLDHLETTPKDPAVYPEFSPALAGAMVDETRRFASLTVLQGDGRLDTLLTASHSYPTEALFELYGVQPPAGFVPGMPVEYDPDERAGLLTHASFLTAHALPNRSGPIQRGVEIRTHLLCDPPPPPPPGVNAEPLPVAPDATTRELLEQHVSDPVCAGCHQFFDGMGLAMEDYDGLGRHRTEEQGKPIDASGSLFATDVDGEVEGGVALAHRLAESEQVRACVTRQWFRFALGRFEADADACTLDTLQHAFADSDADVRALLVDLVRSDAFRFRRGEP